MYVCVATIHIDKICRCYRNVKWISDRAVLSDKWWWKYLFLPQRLRCWHRYLFFTFFVSVNDVSRLVLFSLISSASTKPYTLRHENRLQWRCIAIGCRFFKMSKNFCREWSLQLQLDEWKILNFCPWSYHTDKL